MYSMWEDFLKIDSLKKVDEYRDKYDKNEIVFCSKNEEITFLYNLGLFYAEYLFKNNIERTPIFRKEDNDYLPCFYYLKAIKLFEDNYDIISQDWYMMHEIIRKLYVNLANEYLNQFRTTSAMYYFRKVLKIDNCFDMAIGNFALSIEHHSPLVGLKEINIWKVFNLLYELYFDIDIEQIENGYELFKSKKKHYHKMQEILLHDKKSNYKSYYYFRNIDENDSYENWCIKNILYINYINDLGDFEEAKFDIDISSINDELGLSEAQLYSLNYMIKLYIYQREKTYNCAIQLNEKNIFELIQIFQCLYSYFDKVAFFIYKYFNLVGKEEKVNIKRVWKMKDSEGNELLQYHNQFLYNIYWLRKEYREKGEINELLSPNSHEFAKIRNAIEHQAFSVKNIEGLFYCSPRELLSKTLRLMNVTRDMLLSLIQMVRVENKLRNISGGRRDLDLIYLEHEGFTSI